MVKDSLRVTVETKRSEEVGEAVAGRACTNASHELSRLIAAISVNDKPE